MHIITGKTVLCTSCGRRLSIRKTDQSEFKCKCGAISEYDPQFIDDLLKGKTTI